MTKIIILNGAPGCGKDTLATEIEGITGWEKVSVKTSMFEIAKAMMGDKLYARFMERYDNRELKEVPWDEIGGHSCRTFLIWISETVVKPTFGNKKFGQLLNERIKRGYTHVCSDGGFPDEVEDLLMAGNDICLFRLHREGFTFEGDSRNHITIPWALNSVGYFEYDVHLVDGEIESAARQIIELARRGE